MGPDCQRLVLGLSWRTSSKTAGTSWVHSRGDTIAPTGFGSGVSTRSGISFAYPTLSQPQVVILAIKRTIRREYRRAYPANLPDAVPLVIEVSLLKP